MTTTAPGTTTNSSSTDVPALRMIVQRYRSLQLLIDDNMVSVGHKAGDDACAGLLVYVSFAHSATPALVEQASQTLLNLPVWTLGEWGDGQKTCSLKQLVVDAKQSQPEDDDPKKQNSPHLSLTLVPQANVIAKVKRTGKSIQYRDQIAKSEGEVLYHQFVTSIKTHLVDLEQGGNSAKNNKKTASSDGATSPHPSIPPAMIFQQPGSTNKYGSLDPITGIPLTTIEGEPLSKSARKKCQKQYDTHVKKHDKWLTKQETAAAAASAVPEQSSEQPSPTEEEQMAKAEEPSRVQVVAGSFGKRQGLEFQSDMGPFCHVVELP